MRSGDAERKGVNDEDEMYCRGKKESMMRSGEVQGKGVNDGDEK